ncbi:hypothetical protein BG015_001931 [Linnemannia schmuckeri]|uniref:Uncharacterized protein n=1 Tax=Linnemannia schmuckeri TaxID=64567 RepID=A0A9P5RPM6_9FUNG|nr:hypothetical protein BG015_001931 [Linnemannia schmuckeri]
MGTKPDDHLNYGLHEIFDHAVFKDDLFLQYRANLEEAMARAVPPQPNLLSHNSTAVHAEFRNIDSKVRSGFHNTRMEKTFTTAVKKTLDSNLQRLDKTITAGVGNTVSQQSDIFKGFFTDVMTKQYLAVARAVHRLVQDTLSDFLPYY